MKHLLKSVAILTLVFLFTVGCKKDEESMAVSRIEILTAHDWKFVSVKDGSGKEITELPLGILSTVNITDFLNSTYRFQKDKTLKTKSLLEPDFTDKGKWEFRNNDTILNFDMFGYNPDTEIVELTSDKMTLKISILSFSTIQLFFTK